MAIPGQGLNRRALACGVRRAMSGERRASWQNLTQPAAARGVHVNDGASCDARPVPSHESTSSIAGQAGQASSVPLSASQPRF